MSATGTQGPRRSGRPRDGELTERILDAARNELAAAGIEGFSIRQVALRAGVSRKSVTVRWARSEDLLADAMGAVDMPKFVPSGDLSADLMHLGTQFADGLGSGALDLQLRVSADASRHPEVYAALQRHVLDPMSHALVAAFRAAQVAGQVREGDVAWLVRAFVGAMLARTFQHVDRKPPTTADVAELVEEIANWAAPRP